MNYRPALFCALSLSFGIAFAVFSGYGGKSSAIGFLVAFLLLAFVAVFFAGKPLVGETDEAARLNGDFSKNGRFENGGRRYAFSRLIVLSLAFFVGAFSFLCYRAAYTNGTVFGTKSVVARLDSRADYTDYTRFVFEEVFFDGEEAEGKLVLYLSAYDRDNALYGNAEEGDKAEFTAEISTDTSWVKVDESGETKSRVYYWREKIRFRATEVKDARIVGDDSRLFERLRARLKRTLFSAMNDDAAAVSYALLTGETSETDEGLLENIRYGGVAHIFAVSGLHMGALFAFLVSVFRRKTFSSVPFFVRWAICAALLIFYGGVCGYSASVVRATVTCLVFYADSMLGLKRDGVENLGLAACVVLLISPVSLFDAGFLLSFASAAGILLFSAPSERLALSAFYFLRDKSRAIKRSKASSDANGNAPTSAQTEETPIVAEKSEETKAKVGSSFFHSAIFKKAAKSLLTLACASFSATIATLPVLVHSFSYASVAGVFLNLLVVPAVSAAFPVFVALAFASCIVLPLAPYILFLPSLIVSLFTTFFYAFDFSSFTVALPSSNFAAVCYYAVLLLQCEKLRVNRLVRVFALVFGAVLVCLSIVFA